MGKTEVVNEKRKKLGDGGGDGDVDHERDDGNAGRVSEAKAVFEESEDEVEVDLLDRNGRHAAE